MKVFTVAVLFLARAFAQTLIPIQAGPTINFLPPAVDTTGRTIAFGSTVTPQGSLENTIDLYVGSSKIGTNVTAVGLTRDGSQAVFADVAGGNEGVGVMDMASGALRRVNVDTQGCPLPLCINCFFACVVTPHATADGSKVLFAVRRNQPFQLVNSDLTGLTRLPIFSGALAASPQRVISTSGQVVFTSFAPSGPTVPAAATDVFLMNLDGTNIRNLTKFANSAVFCSNATISADGATIVFETNYAGAGSAPAQETQIWAVQSDGSGLRQLTYGPGASTNPSISADGKSGLFLQAGLINLLQPFIDVQPHGPRFSIAVLRYSVPQSPVISDDGTRVAFLIGPANSSGGAVYEVNSDGTSLHAVYAPRAISHGGVVSAAGLGPPPSPGGLFSVYGINFSGDSITGASGFPLPRTLGGASVLVNGAQVPMLSTSPWQLTAQLPPDAPVQSSNFQASFVDGTITPAEVTTVVTAAPALFGSQLQSSDMIVDQAAVFHAGTAIPADDEHPAKAGEILEMYGTGIGPTDPVAPAGQPSPANPVARALMQPVVRIGTVEATVLFAGLTPGLAGVAQLNIVVPSGLKPGRYPVSLGGNGEGLDAAASIVIQ
jgi:uncharacterized protein (TIGR03437 family)